VAAVDSPRLNRVYPAMQEEMRLGLAQLSSSYPLPQDLAGEHRRLLTTVTSGDVANAQQEMRDHLGTALRGLTT
jgi:DNA-binding GntR family transcriptional regulator